MSYEKFVATYRNLRHTHQHNPEAIEIIDQFGREAAYLRVLDERAAKLEAELAITKASQSSRSSD